ncbi:MAG: MGH1-like glycoside hydrolase domain-containing protein [Solirubrobacterales bacterium]
MTGVNDGSSASRPGPANDGSVASSLEIAERTLRASWIEGDRDGVGYAYSRPSPSHYFWQWSWDSGFHAIVWRRFAPERSELELTSLLNGGREDGFIGHTIFWDRPVDMRRRWTYNIASREAPNTATIQPPLLAWAWRTAVGDPVEEPRIAAHHRWLEQYRDLDGDGLLWILQPDESGLDSSPKFDPVWGRRAHARLGFIALIQRNRRRDWDARRVLADGGPMLCEVVVNVLWGLSRLAAGEPSITPALIDRLWDEKRALFLDVARGDVAHEGEMDAVGSDWRLRTSTWSALAPLALPDLPEQIGRRLVEEHLLDPERYWTPVPPPSVSAEEPSFDPRGWTGAFVRRYWRGPTWINSAWLIWLGLRRLRYDDQADEMAAVLCQTYAREGSREFYEPFTGEGLGAVDFGWSTLIAELADPDPRAGRSHL